MLITNQIKGIYEAREESMKRYLAKVQHLQDQFDKFFIFQVPRSKNKRDDALSKLASSSFAHLTKNVLVEVVPCRSIDIDVVNSSTTQETTWMDPIVDYLENGNLPTDSAIARKIRIKAPQYSMKKASYIRKDI